MTSPPGAPAPRPPSSATTGPPSTRRLIIIVAGVIGGIFLLIAGCLALAAFLFVSNVHVSANPGPRLGHEDGVRIETPLGSLRVQKQREIDPKLLSLPLYPGAVSVQGEGLGARVDLDLDFADKSLRVAAIQMETDDEIEKVIAFYRREAVGYSFHQKHGNAAEFHRSEGPRKKIVAVSEHRGKTRIALANIGEPEAN